MLSITETSSFEKKDLKDFIEVPYILNKNSRHWVPEPRFSVFQLLSRQYPAWGEMERMFFTAYRGNKPVGRIAAMLNRAHNNYHKDKIGFFGFFECENNAETARELVLRARNWLKARGMDKMRGPMNPSTNESCGVLVSGFDSPPKIMMPYNAEYYDELLQSAGLVKAKDLLAFTRFQHTPITERIQKIINRIKTRPDIKIKEINLKKLKEELELVRVIYNEAWGQNWSFVPMSADEMKFTAKNLEMIIKPDNVHFIEIGGKPAAFSLVLPDVNIAFKKINGKLNPLTILPFIFALRKIKQGRMLTLGVRPEFRSRGLELLLIEHAIEHAGKNGWTHAELSWVLEDNQKIISVIEECGGRLYKKYRIYETDII